MSLSQPRETSPVRKYIRINSSKGAITWYDKARGQEIDIPTPFRFVVLDTLISAGGWHDASGSSIWANEVRTNNDVLNVRTKSGVLISGPYSDIKDRLRGLGGKFSQSCYLAYEDGGEWALGNLKLIGASVSAWFDFRQTGGGKDSDPGVVITGFEPKKKGATSYHAPIFERWTVPAEDLQAASALDTVLQDYLAVSLSRKPEAEPQATSPEPAYVPAASFQSEAPF